MSLHSALKSFALAVVLMVTAGGASAEAAPASFNLVSPNSGAYLNTRTPTLVWNATTSPAGMNAYAVYIDGQLEDLVDPASCSITCSFSVSEPLDEGYGWWHVVAIDSNQDISVATAREFTIDVTPPSALTLSLSLNGLPGVSRVTTGCTPIPSASSSEPVTVAYTLDGAPFRQTCSLPHGTHGIVATATDRAGNTATAATEFRTDLRQPVVTIEGPTRGAVAQPGRWRAVVAPGTATPPLRFQWTGGIYPGAELHDGRFAWRPRQQHPLTVIVTDADGEVGTASLALTTGGTAPPVGPVGFSINSAKSLIHGKVRYTNRRSARLDLVWPAGASTFTVSDSLDGRTWTSAVAKSVAWRLAGAGGDGRVSTIRVQYDWPDPNAVYEAKVMLDLEPPVVSKATVSGRRLRLAAHDRVSGIAELQIAKTRSRPAKRRPYRTSLEIAGARWVRVFDKARNTSKWARIRRR